MKLKRSVIHLVILLTTVFSVEGLAQQFTASAPSQVAVGQRFRVAWQLDANGSGFIAPEIRDFFVRSGPNQSTSMQYVNGSMSQSVTYSYVLEAKQEGEFTIAPAKIKANGKVIESNPLTIKVVKGQDASSSQGQESTRNSASTQKSSANGQDLFARIEVEKTSAYLGEKILVDLKIYTRVSLVNFEDWKMPSFEGFYMKEVNPDRQVNLQNEVIDGVMYQVGLLKQVVLYPQKSGKLTIDPMELGVIVRERTQGSGRSIFDSFFGGYQDSRRDVRSNSVTINVKPYPGGKPSDFSGLTGKLSMTASLDKTETRSNEAVTLQYRVSGEGNLYQLQPPKLEFPPDIEVYDPKISDNIRVTANGISGSRTFEYVLIPRYAGQFQIGPFSFSYFDPRSGTFKTITQDAFILKVEKGEGDQGTPSAMNLTSKEDIKLIGSDIRYIKQGQYPLVKGVRFFYRSPRYYAALAVPFVLFILILGYTGYTQAQGRDVVKLKSKRATGLAKKRLKKAKKLWDDKQTSAFYEEVFKALSDYAANKFSIPVSHLSKQKIKEVMLSRNVPEETVNEFISVLDKTEFARFAPGADKQMESMYDEALKAIVNVENHA